MHLEQAKQVIPGRIYQLIRSGDRFAIEKKEEHAPQPMHRLARRDRLVLSRTETGYDVVTDALYLELFPGYARLYGSHDDSIQTEAVASWDKPHLSVEDKDALLLAVREETARQLANLLHVPVHMDYVAEATGRKTERQFTPDA